jgi:hypothetical protein
MAVAVLLGCVYDAGRVEVSPDFEFIKFAITIVQPASAGW